MKERVERTLLPLAALATLLALTILAILATRTRLLCESLLTRLCQSRDDSRWLEGTVRLRGSPPESTEDCTLSGSV